jgi:hypothetical protein
VVTIKRTGDSNRRYIEAVERSSKVHIEAVEKASANQIIDTRYWKDLKRKQLLKMLVQELKNNVILYDKIVKKDEEKRYKGLFMNFSFVALEKCLIDTPIDDDAINLNISIIYYIIKLHNNEINSTRGGLYTVES